jgi:hypothetical protein
MNTEARLHRLSIILLVIAGCSLFKNPAQAQFTNFFQVAPLTKLESFDTNISVVILKATTEVGSISSDAGDVAVKSKEITDTSTGRKEQGIAVEITPRGQAKETLLVDYDEMASLANAIDYISKLDVTATPLTAFDAAYTTKGGFRIAALGTRRTGAIQFGVRDARTFSTPVTFSRDEMTRLSGLINQARGILDSLRR